ncbi:MAG TPA: peptidoglycan DD-metalloendopeptidase family protein, partial [Plasticicumulans sp.]|nr:peptidoglycan DD-metalloendopeptidase family protein [Plasticicumulans sp.]
TTAGVAAARPVAARASADDGDDSLARGPWRWPVRGELLRRYDADGPGRKGIEIGAGLGQTVSAAQGGEVVYSGSGLPGYGRLIIIKHSESMLSAYGFLGKILLNEGDKVRAGQAIGEVGTSSENRPALHFEIRQNGRPVDPLRYLPG